MARKKTVQAEADLEVKVNIDELQPLDPEPIEIGDIENPEPDPVKTVPILARSLGLRSPQDDNHAVKTFLFVSQAITAAGTGGATQIDTPQPVVSFSIPDRTYSRIDEVEVDIRPIQDFNGYNNPWPPGGGKNLFGGEYNVRFTFAEPIPSGTVISVSGSTTTSDNTRCNLYNAVGTRFQNFGLNELVDGRKVRNNYTLNDDAYEVLFDIAEADDFQIEISPTATSYVPYSNICPISGRDSVSVTVSPTLDAQDGTTYTITLPQTVYGGMLEVTRGKLTVTHGMIASYNGEPLPGAWISDRDVYAEGTTPTIGAQVVYELETPIILHITPVGSIQLLEGQNNIFADTGDILRIAYSYENMI